MKYLRPYNESLSEQSFKEALEIYTEELPFEMNDIRIEVVNSILFPNESYYVIKYVHVDPRIDYTTGTYNNSITKRNTTADVLKFNDMRLRKTIEDDADFYFTKFAKKYDLIYCVCAVILGDDIDVRVKIKSKKTTTLKYFKEALNESFKTKDFENALEIYAEELPFNIDDIILNYANMSGKESDCIVLTYQHTADDLKHFIELDRIKGLLIDVNGILSINKQMSTEVLEDVDHQVRHDVTIYFGKFAKKYDMVISNVYVSSWFDTVDPNIEWVKAYDDIKISTTVRIKFTSTDLKLRNQKWI